MTWVAALIALSVIVHQADAVGLALAIVAVSIALGAVASLLMRKARQREEAERE